MREKGSNFMQESRFGILENEDIAMQVENDVVEPLSTTETDKYKANISCYTPDTPDIKRSIKTLHGENVGKDSRFEAFNSLNEETLAHYNNMEFSSTITNTHKQAATSSRTVKSPKNQTPNS